MGLSDTTGKEVVAMLYDDANTFAEGLGVVLKKGGKHGFVDATGKVVIPFNFESASSFSEGLAAVSRNGSGVYRQNGQGKSFPCKYGFAGSFSDGVAKVRKKP